MVTYFKIAMGLETFRVAASNFAAIKSNPLALPVLLANKINWRVPAFLVGYASVYRVQD